MRLPLTAESEAICISDYLRAYREFRDAQKAAAAARLEEDRLRKEAQSCKDAMLSLVSSDLRRRNFLHGATLVIVEWHAVGSCSVSVEDIERTI